MEELLKEYKNFLQDTNKTNNIISWQSFKREYVTWYIEMFGISDERTENIIKELNNIKYKNLRNIFESEAE